MVVVQRMEWKEMEWSPVGTLVVIKVTNDEDLSPNDHNENRKGGAGMKDIWGIWSTEFGGSLNVGCETGLGELSHLQTDWVEGKDFHQDKRWRRADE